MESRLALDVGLNVAEMSNIVAASTYARFAGYIKAKCTRVPLRLYTILD